MRTQHLLLVATILCLGCGSSGGGRQDSGTDTGVDTDMDDTGQDSVLDAPVDMSVDDPTEDVPLDAPDASTDAEPDASLDAEPDAPALIDVEISDAEVMVNPYGEAPLTAVIVFSHDDLAPDDVTSMDVTVVGMAAGFEDLTATMDPRSAQFAENFDVTDLLDAGQVGIPVLGLYQDATNTVRFEARTATHRYHGQVEATTNSISSLMDSVITVDVMDADAMIPGFTYLDNYVFDHHGNVRWSGPPITRLLADGNILSRIHEITWLGKTLDTRSLPDGMNWHHDSIELPAGNIVICATNPTSSVVASDGSTVESVADYVMEMQRSTGDVVNAWDLRTFLDVDRGTVVDGMDDWAHMNTLAYDAEDDTIIVSNRYQGIAKLTRGGIQGPTANRGKELVWILSPHMGWGLGGWDGTGPQVPADHLLTAVDSTGISYPTDVQQNLEIPDASLDDFHWAIGQHGLAITGHSGDTLSFLTFDNLASFIFDGPDSVNNGVSKSVYGDLSNDRANPPYSLLVEYQVDETLMTVTQTWSYGALLPELFGSRNGGVHYDPTTGNRILVSNGLDPNPATPNVLNPHVVELTADGTPVFHLEITSTSLSAYRAGRIDLFHPDVH